MSGRLSGCAMCLPLCCFGLLAVKGPRLGNTPHLHIPSLHKTQQWGNLPSFHQGMPPSPPPTCKDHMRLVCRPDAHLASKPTQPLATSTLLHQFLTQIPTCTPARPLYPPSLPPSLPPSPPLDLLVPSHTTRRNAVATPKAQPMAILLAPDEAREQIRTAPTPPSCHRRPAGFRSLAPGLARHDARGRGPARRRCSSKVGDRA